MAEHHVVQPVCADRATRVANLWPRPQLRLERSRESRPWGPLGSPEPRRRQAPLGPGIGIVIADPPRGAGGSGTHSARRQRSQGIAWSRSLYSAEDDRRIRTRS